MEGTIAAQDLRVGDMVWTSNGGRITVAATDRTALGLVTIDASDGSRLLLTKDAPVLMKRWEA